METKPAKTTKNNYWLIFVFLLIAVIALIIFQSEVKEKKKNSKFSSRSNWNNNDYKRRKNNLSDREDQEDNDENEEENDEEDYNYQLFRQKGYFERDIKELKNWGFEASEVPDLKTEKRRGVVNTLAVDAESEERGFCSELVILLKESPRPMNLDNLEDNLKINQSQGFAESTRNNNSQVIKFAIRKIIQQGHKWEHDVYVLKVNSAATIAGTSAGSGVYLALLSARFSNCTLSKKLAITGVLDTEKKNISAPITPNPKKYHWQADLCSQCEKRSQIYHYIYNKTAHKLEQSFSNATDPNSQWVFCTKDCFQKWWGENVYNCTECNKQRFGNCSCCSKYYSWIQKNNEYQQFCSEKCVNDYYPSTYEEGKIRAIAGLAGKISAAVEKDCDTIILPNTNSDNYYAEVPLSVRAKVKKLHQVENWKDLWNFNLK